MMNKDEARHTYGSYFMLAPDPSCILDYSGTIRAVNSAWQKQIGEIPAKPGPPSFIDLVTPEERSTAWQKIQELVFARAGTAVFTCRCQTPAGGREWWYWTAVIDSSPETIYLTGKKAASHHQKDDTAPFAAAWNNAELHQALNHSDARFRALFDSASVGIVIIDKNGRIILTNNEISRLFGYDQNDLPGQPIEILLPLRFQRTHQQHRTGYFADPRRRPMGSDLELSGQHQDGREFPVEVSLSTLEMDGQTLALGFVVDISRRRQAERDVARRTEELRRSNEELEQFAYVISHDLRAPIRALNTYSQFLLEDNADQLDEDGLDYLAGIGESAQQMDALVVGLLEYARIGRTDKAKAEVDIRILLDKIIRQNRFHESAEFHLPENPALVHASTVRLEQIFVNLISNAIKFRRQDVPPIIRIQWTELPSHWEFSLSDNGIGIPQKHHQRIFGVFQRLHTADEYEGTGIGLSIVKKAVEAQGGQITVSSATGQGTTFSFTLPKEDKIDEGHL